MDTRGLTYELRLKTYDALLWRYHALYVKEFARGRLNDEEFEKIKQMFVEACHMAKALLQDFVKRYDETETEDFDIVIERAEHWQIIHYTDSWKKMYQKLLPTVEAGMLPSKDRLQVFSAYDLLKIPNYELAAWFILEKENGVTGKEDPKLLRKLSNYLCNTVSPYRNDFPGILFTTQAEFWHIAERHDYGDIHPDDWDTSVRYFFKDIMTDYMKARGLDIPEGVEGRITGTIDK